MAQSFGKAVKDALATITDQVTIAEATEYVREALNGLIDDHAKKLADDQLRSVIRKEFKTTRDGDGLSQWQSVERQDADGNTERVYKQLALLDKQDFAIQIDYHSRIATYHAQTANTLTDRGNKMHKMKRQLPFPDFGVLSEDELAVA